MVHAHSLSIRQEEVHSEVLDAPEFPLVDAAEKRMNILLVEDLQSDATLTRLALEATHVPITLSRLRRGDEVIPHLNICRMCCPLELPDLIMLDLGLPGKDGFEILTELSEMPSSVRSIPIAVLTSHKHFEYIRNSYPLYIMAYINKPCSAEAMQVVLKQLKKTIRAG